MCLLSVSCMAQNGFLDLKQDPRIDTLVSKQRQIYTNDNTIDGFRVQIFMETGNNAVRHADSVKHLFMQQYPDIPIYLVFGQPYYRLRIGDFRTRLEAENQYQQIKKEFVNSFVTADRINLPYNPLSDVVDYHDIEAMDTLRKKVFIEEVDLMFDTLFLDSLYRYDTAFRKIDSIYYEDIK